MRQVRLLAWWALTLGALLGLAVSPASAAPAGPAARSPAVPSAHVAAAPPGKTLELVLPLNVDSAGLDRFATAVSTPGSPYFGHYASVASLAQRFGASASARARVLAYLHRVGATGVSIDATGMFADATMSVRLAERLFAVALEQFRSASGTSFTAPAAPVRIPRALRGLVTGVVGLDTRPIAATPPIRRAFRAHPTAGPPPSGYVNATGTPRGCSQAIRTGGFTPNQYLTAYGFDPLHAARAAGQGERVALIEIDGFKRSDIQTFAHCFGLRVPRINSFGVGFKRGLSPGSEATLDLEVLTAAAPRLRGVDVYESKADSAHVLRAFTAPLQNPGFKPQVISASLGLCEPFVLGAIGRSGVRGADNILALAAASGITVLGSSGDSGSADCTGPGGFPFHQLAVNFPASSPFITAVGGTNFTLNSANAIVDQRVWNDTSVIPGAAGGGGPSEVFARPGYQKGTVGARTRALPDVSMLADIAPGYVIFCSARECVRQNSPRWQSVGGTSASTPLLAGGLALIDQSLRVGGRQDLGLVNPLLYSIGRNPSLSGRVFYDVTQFNNDVGAYISRSHTPLGCCDAGPGFDEASGWGSVNITNLASVALGVEPKTANVSLRLPRHQHPVRRRRILAHVSCSAACFLAAFAEVRIGSARAFTVASKAFRLRSRGGRTVALRFNARQLARVRSALRHHRRVRAKVFGVSLDPGGVIEKETSGITLAIRS